MPARVTGFSLQRWTPMPTLERVRGFILRRWTPMPTLERVRGFSRRRWTDSLIQSSARPFRTLDVILTRRRLVTQAKCSRPSAGSYRTLFFVRVVGLVICPILVNNVHYRANTFNHCTEAIGYTPHGFLEGIWSLRGNRLHLHSARILLKSFFLNLRSLH